MQCSSCWVGGFNCLIFWPGVGSICWNCISILRQQMDRLDYVLVKDKVLCTGCAHYVNGPMWIFSNSNNLYCEICTKVRIWEQQRQSIPKGPSEKVWPKEGF